MREEESGNPPAYCAHTPPMVTVIHEDGGMVRVQCLRCGTIGPEREGPAEAFRALMRTLYRADRSDLERDS